MGEKYQVWSQKGEIGEVSNTYNPTDHDLYTFWFGWENASAWTHNLNLDCVTKEPL